MSLFPTVRRSWVPLESPVLPLYFSCDELVDLYVGGDPNLLVPNEHKNRMHRLRTVLDVGTNE